MAGWPGSCLARQLKLEAPDLRCSWSRSGGTRCARRRSRSANRASKSARTIFRRSLGLEPHLRGATPRETRTAVLLSPRRQPRDRRAESSLGRRLSPGAVVPARSRPSGEHLLQASARAGREVLDGCRGASDRRWAIRITTSSSTVGRTAPRRVRSRWIVDASGRAGLMKRQLGLARTVAHGANACWFRIKSSVRVDDWSDDPAWRARVPCGQRWQSTNHLMGAATGCG